MLLDYDSLFQQTLQWQLFHAMVNSLYLNEFHTLSSVLSFLHISKNEISKSVFHLARSGCLPFEHTRMNSIQFVILVDNSMILSNGTLTTFWSESCVHTLKVCVSTYSNIVLQQQQQQQPLYKSCWRGRKSDLNINQKMTAVECTRKFSPLLIH